MLIGSPAYFAQAGTPERPEDLARHACLLYRFPSTGKLDVWPVLRGSALSAQELPVGMVTNTLDPQLSLAEQGFGIACVPELAVHAPLQPGPGWSRCWTPTTRSEWCLMCCGPPAARSRPRSTPL